MERMLSDEQWGSHRKAGGRQPPDLGGHPMGARDWLPLEDLPSEYDRRLREWQEQGEGWG